MFGHYTGESNLQFSRVRNMYYNDNIELNDAGLIIKYPTKIVFKWRFDVPLQESHAAFNRWIHKNKLENITNPLREFIDKHKYSIN